MQLFLDLDGVLADFEGGYLQRFGRVTNKTLDNADWDLIRATPGFYRDLPPMPDMAELIDGTRRYNPIILTGTPPAVPEARENKRQWVDRHLGKDFPMISCASRDKAKHAKPGDILIDDWDKYRDLWRAVPGHFILHTSATTSLQTLAQILGEAPYVPDR